MAAKNKNKNKNKNTKKNKRSVQPRKPPKPPKKNIGPGITEIKDNDYKDITKTGKKTMIRKIKDWYLRRFKFDSNFLINMELDNGDIRTFLVMNDRGTFKYKSGVYIIDSSMKYYNLDAKMYCLDYHESFSMPIKKHYPVNDIKDAMEAADNIEIEYATNPTTLERFMVAKIAEGIMKGQQLDEMMKRILTVAMIGMILTAILLILYVNHTGMLDSIKGTVGI